VHRDGTLRDVDSPEDACRQAEQCTREELSEFAAAALALGVRYLGICCGAAPHHIRAVAEAAGHTPPASRYSPDMSRHSFLGTAPGVTPSYQDYASQL
jgi:betaine-homocysteine S-methyltransferase